MTRELTSLENEARRWGERPDISARSVLVTIMGDTVAPLGGTVWLADLIHLSGQFGFNERLVRTSMFRLVAERWVANERVGRRSRYSLTPFGRDEFAEADARIYGRGGADWDGMWTLVFVVSGDETESDLVQHLRWHGFAEITKDVYAIPSGDVAATRKLFDRLDVDPHPPVATAHFDQLQAVARARSFHDTSGLADAEDGYRAFVDRYDWTVSAGVDRLSPRESFTLRTMLIHDLRRARLRDPELPAELLPTDWVGHQALDLAESIYRAVTEKSWLWVQSVTGLSTNPSDPILSNRFAPAA